MSTPKQRQLPLARGNEDIEQRVEINGRYWFVDRDGMRVVYRGWDAPVYAISLDDGEFLQFVAVQMCRGQMARQEQVAPHFGMSVRTLQRKIRRYEAHGLSGLQRKEGSGAPRKIAPSQEAYIRKWHAAGESNSEIARRLGVSEGTVRSALKRMGLAPEAVDATRPMFDEDVDHGDPDAGATHERSARHDRGRKGLASSGTLAAHSDPRDRSIDRTFAAMGLIDDADPIFATECAVPRAGVFIAVAMLAESGVVEIFERLYRTIGPAFYGLRTSVVCMVVMALLRIKRPENLKEHSPGALGRLLGLDRAPEVKTLRRKLAKLAARGLGKELMHALAEHHINAHRESTGVLYVDGHVKEYSGKANVSKAYVTQRRLAVPGEVATWVNDVRGDPLFVVPSEMNAGLSKTLLPVLSEVRELVGAKRDITVVFDRGGWSSRLFHQLMQAGFHVITYRKGHKPRIPKTQFTTRSLQMDGHTFTYEIHDKPRVRVGASGVKTPKYVWMRQVTRLRDGERQTPVITDRNDLAAEEVLYLMFNRWRQENFFKYLREEFALDAMVEYAAEPVDDGSTRPNPEIRDLDKQLKPARSTLAGLQRLLGIEIADNDERKRPTVRGFKIATADIRGEIQATKDKIERLEADKARLPKRISADGVMRLKQERKAIADAIRIVAYRIESDLVRMLADHYRRTEDEGRTLLQAAFQSTGDIEVADDELRVTLAPLSSPHRTQAIAALCERLTERHATFPGTKLRIVLRAAEPVTIP